MSTQLKDKLLKKIDQLKSEPENSKISFRVQTHLVSGLLTNATIRKFNFNIDEPLELGGTDIAPNPIELVLAALGACQEIVYSAYAGVLGIKLESVTVSVKGTLDLHGMFGTAENVNAGLESVEYETEIISEDSQEKIQQLVKLVTAHCPVFDTLTRQIPVSGNVKIHNTKAAA